MKTRELGVLAGRVPVAMHAGTRRIAVYSPGSCLLSRPNRVHFYDWSTLQLVLKASCDIIYLDRITFSPDGSLLAGGCFNTEHKLSAFITTLSDAKQHKVRYGETPTLAPFKPSGSHCVCFDPSGDYFAVADNTGPHVYCLGVPRVVSGSPLIVGYLTAEGRLLTCHALRYSPDGKTLAQQCTWTNDGFVQTNLFRGVKLWRVEVTEGAVKLSFRGTFQYAGTGLTTDSHPIGLAFSPDGRLLAVGGDQKGADKIKLVSLEGLEWLGSSPELGSGVSWLCFTETGDHLVSGSMDGAVRRWKLNRGAEGTSLDLIDEARASGAILDAVLIGGGRTAVAAYQATGGVGVAEFA
jgi:WD40 repeat protein